MAGASVTAARREGLAQLYAAERQQKDNLCGCFWAALALRAAGIDADQDGVAVAAGAILPGGDPQTHVAPGATPRNDYRVELPRRCHARASPAPPHPRSPARSSASRPAPWRRSRSPARGRPDSVRTLMDAATDATLIANVRTAASSGARTPTPAAVLAHLRGEDVEPPPADWDVGHFVNFAALVRGPAADLVVVRDTYQELGIDGHHLQPPGRGSPPRFAATTATRAACWRVVESAPLARRACATRLEREGFELRHWHNGTPDPEGTT